VVLDSLDCLVVQSLLAKQFRPVLSGQYCQVAWVAAVAQIEQLLQKILDGQQVCGDDLTERGPQSMRQKCWSSLRSLEVKAVVCRPRKPS
jgi:hypothetical protein